MQTVEDRVRAGATMLDSVSVGWAGKIDIELLDIGSCTRCLFGQLFGNYLTGIDRLGLCGEDHDPFARAHDLGFTDRPFDRVADFTPLREAWLTEIAARIADPEDHAVPTRDEAAAWEACPL